MTDTDLTSFKVIGVEPFEFGCHADVPTLILWAGKVVASDAAGVRKAIQCREEPWLFLLRIDANGAHKVFGQTSNVSPFMRKHIQLVLDLQGGETIVRVLGDRRTYIAFVYQCKVILVNANDTG